MTGSPWPRQWRTAPSLWTWEWIKEQHCAQASVTLYTITIRRSSHVPQPAILPSYSGNLTNLWTGFVTKIFNISYEWLPPSSGMGQILLTTSGRDARSTRKHCSSIGKSLWLGVYIPNRGLWQTFDSELCSQPATTTTFMCLTLWRGWKCSRHSTATLLMKLVRLL